MDIKDHKKCPFCNEEWVSDINIKISCKFCGMPIINNPYKIMKSKLQDFCDGCYEIYYAIHNNPGKEAEKKLLSRYKTINGVKNG